MSNEIIIVTETKHIARYAVTDEAFARLNLVPGNNGEVEGLLGVLEDLDYTESGVTLIDDTFEEGDSTVEAWVDL